MGLLNRLGIAGGIAGAVLAGGMLLKRDHYKGEGYRFLNKNSTAVSTPYDEFEMREVSSIETIPFKPEKERDIEDAGRMPDGNYVDAAELLPLALDGLIENFTLISDAYTRNESLFDAYNYGRINENGVKLSHTRDWNGHSFSFDCDDIFLRVFYPTCYGGPINIGLYKPTYLPAFFRYYRGPGELLGEIEVYPGHGQIYDNFTFFRDAFENMSPR